MTSEEPTSETLTSEGLLGEVAHGSGSALALVQGLLDADVAPAGGVWLVTRGAQSLGRERGGGVVRSGAVGAGPHGGVGGAGARVRGWWTSTLGPKPTLARWSMSCSPRTERRRWRIAVGCVMGHGWVRGVSVEEPARPGLSEGRLRGDGTYLVTGGLGGIGRELAGWLAEHGAGAIVLNGRRAPDPEAEAVLDALRERGVRVEVEIADVSDGEAVEAMLGRIGERLPPLAGVIHSVGVLSDAALTNQDWERFERVLGPKMVGAWHLHRAHSRPGA